jgi:hypothetical protein
MEGCDSGNSWELDGQELIQDIQDTDRGFQFPEATPQDSKGLRWGTTRHSPGISLARYCHF